jgi:hypothetical protein
MNVDLHIGQNFRYQLVQALLIYAGNSDARGGSFVTLHDVQGESTPTLGPAQRLSTAFLASLANNLQRNVGVEILPENVLARTNDMFMWWTPAQIRPMFFGSPDGKMAALNGLSFPQPALVFLAHEHALSVRVYENGSICLGSTPIPTSPSVSTIPQWERAFFQSEFTHPNGAQRITTCKGGFAALWQALAGKDQFPARYLVDAKQTLAAFIEKHHAN